MVSVHLARLAAIELISAICGARAASGVLWAETPASNKTHPFRLVLAEISQLSDRGGKRRIFLFGMHPRSTVTHKLSTASLRLG
jgi:hypothetical protein